MPSTFFTAPPHWQWYIILYFFIGGIAGGSLFLAALLRLFGSPADRAVSRLGYYVAFVGAILSGVLLIVDLDRPLRFWHMLVQSETLRPMFKLWTPMSVGSWVVLLFGMFAFLASLGALYEEGRLRWRPLRFLADGALAVAIVIAGAVFGLFLAGYTGVLLSVTNRPIWADSTWVGILFLFSGASTAAASLILLSLWRRAGDAHTLEWLSRFDKWALGLELIALVIFVVSLGAVARVFVGWWGALLVIGVVIAGILLPLSMSYGRPWRVEHPLASMAGLVLLGGFLLRVVVILSSEQIQLLGPQVVGR